MTLAQITNGQIEGWVILSYFHGTPEEGLIDYAEYWIRRLGINRTNYHLYST